MEQMWLNIWTMLKSIHFRRNPNQAKEKIINEIDNSTSSIKEFLSYIKGGKKKQKTDFPEMILRGLDTKTKRERRTKTTKEIFLIIAFTIV